MLMANTPQDTVLFKRLQSAVVSLRTFSVLPYPSQLPAFLIYFLLFMSKIGL